MSLRAVVFDYGNTLVHFSGPQIRQCDDALAAALVERFGAVDREKLAAIRHQDRMAPYAGDPPRWVENDLPTITRGLVRALYGDEPDEDTLAALLAVRRSAFVGSIAAEPHVHDVLAALKERHAVALVSNYPCGVAIRTSLERTGLAPYLDAVVVSGDVGHVKPHPAPFLAALEAIGVAPEDAVYVGDNWLADVQGSKRAGLRSVWMRRWDAPERFEPKPGDHLPDAEIAHLEDLPGTVERLAAAR